MRKENRRNDQIRSVTVERGFQPHADASVLLKMGDTHVICSVTIEKGVPPFLKDTGQGWITAEYGMLPCATHSRGNREAVRGRSGRTFEIQRLIGRSLRMMVDLKLLGEITLRVDCDVVNADGGTRCAAITGSSLAVRDAIRKMAEEGLLPIPPRILPVAAISIVALNGALLLDPDYAEDSTADADANFIMTADGRIVETQCTAESAPMSKAEFTSMLDLAERGTQELFQLWQQ